MIIKCEKCHTKFRLDNSRVTDRGVKVRCTKCKHVFRVHKENAEELLSQPGATLADFSSPVEGEVPISSADERLILDESAPVATESFQVSPIAAASADSIEFDPSFFDTPETSFPADDLAANDNRNVPAVADDTSFAGGEIDFSAEDMFGAVVESVPETQGDAPFNLGEIDFGDELTAVAVQQVNSEELKPSQESSFAPQAETEEKLVEDVSSPSFLHEGPASFQQDLPPLSTSSRRKQSPLFVGIIVLVLLLIIAVLGYLGFSSLSTPKEAVVTESGKIGVRSVTAAYIKNDKVGELLVISGEALNEYPKARAALQVKVALFDATGQAVTTKSAYCGNPLTGEQLKSLPVEKIEAAMANQFGDSLANMEVNPGKAIPFVVVIANIPDGAKDFSVQSAGSTVAAGKQQ